MPLYDADDTYPGTFRVMRINATTISITGHNPALRIYNVVVDIIRIVKVVTSTGIQESTETLASNWSCAINWKMGSEKILFDKETYFQDAVLTCRVIGGVTITNTDRVVHEGNVFEIVGITDINNLGRRLKIALRRVA